MEDYLMHHGILGQKWGVRRYQNKDGSLTSEGREHYGQNKPATLKQKRLSRAISKQDRDIADLRKHGYNKEADAVQGVRDKTAKKLEDSYSKQGLTDTQKKIAKAALLAGAAAVATYGVYEMSKIDSESWVEDGKFMTSNIFGKVKEYPVTGISTFADGSKLYESRDDRNKLRTATTGATNLSSSFREEQASKAEKQLNARKYWRY